MFSSNLHLEIVSEEAHVGESTVVCQPDLLPVPKSARTWHALHLGGYWVAEAFVDQYQVAASAVAAGLSPGTAIGAVFLGHVLVAIACACNGWIGATYGINFPVFARASFGIYGNLIAVMCRAVAAVIWFGTQTFQGGQCVQVMLQAIWPSFKKFKNHLPLSAHVTSAELLCFFIFYIIQLPLLFIHISKLRHLFMLKVIIMAVGWAVGRAHGFGPIFTQKTHVQGSPVVVVFFSAMTSAIAPKATLALNICDFTRFAKSPRTVVWTNIFALSILVTLCAILGVVVTSATQVIYGVSTWNPLQVCDLWSSRAAQFFAAFCWGLAAIATNISANSTAVGNDLAILFPRYINIRRGQYICAVLGLATCPWIIQNNAASFTYLRSSGYSIFLGPICGITLADFYIRQRGSLDLAALYHKETSSYWYTHGFNLRAIAAFVLALVPNLPGFAAKINNKHSPAAQYIFSVVWLVGIVVAATCYLLFNLLWPVTVTFRHRQAQDGTPPQSINNDKDPEKVMEK
ncbi:permease for cytosine/purines, uracil, thiamine, allantoin-domain-containing protein [Mycena rosella]|uniref:Permease for cytosine/purines, uracil, thiamine, allantoin-domain-containing protein n=1 Tax=Mycena rosella TaxID=1033263 RepID=A0AAD7GW77_MYCRO|nr:permease for cytosine/purines, uracil, thiamine, allantoin-domain-containing protein [Mycena rosella]